MSTAALRLHAGQRTHTRRRTYGRSGGVGTSDRAVRAPGGGKDQAAAGRGLDLAPLVGVAACHAWHDTRGREPAAARGAGGYPEGPAKAPVNDLTGPSVLEYRLGASGALLVSSHFAIANEV